MPTGQTALPQRAMAQEKKRGVTGQLPPPLNTLDYTRLNMCHYCKLAGKPSAMLPNSENMFGSMVLLRERTEPSPMP